MLEALTEQFRLSLAVVVVSVMSAQVVTALLVTLKGRVTYVAVEQMGVLPGGLTPRVGLEHCKACGADSMHRRGFQDSNNGKAVAIRQQCSQQQT